MSLRLLLLQEAFSAHRLPLAPRLSRADGQNIFPGYKNICSSCTALRFVRHSLENVLGKGQNSRRTWPRCVVRGPIRIQQAEIDWTSWPYCCGVSGTQSSSHREICFARPRRGCTFDAEWLLLFGFDAAWTSLILVREAKVCVFPRQCGLCTGKLSSLDYWRV